MLVTIYTDTFEESQKLYDLCNINNELSFGFLGEYNGDFPEGYYGIDITVETWEDLSALEKVSKFVYMYFKEKKND